MILKLRSHISFIFITALLLSAPTASFAHSEATGDEPPLENYLNFAEKLGNLNIIESDDRSMEATVQISHFPFFNIGGKKVVVDNAFLDMADELSRIFIQGIKESCNECILPSVEDVRAQVEVLIAKGWLTSKASAIGNSVRYRYVGEFAGLGARYGTASGIAKVAGELVEDAMLVIFKMPGAHFLCEAITAAIAYYSGGVLTIARTLTMSKHFNMGRISTLVRLSVTSHYINRALNRLIIQVPEFTINEENFEEFKDENPERKLTYTITGRHRAQSFLRKLEKELSQKRAKIENLKNKPGNLSKKQQQMLITAENDGISTLTTIHKKVFDGYRYKRFLLLKKRNSATTMTSFAPHTSPLFTGTNFWFLELKNEIFEPNVSVEAEKEYRRNGLQPKAAYEKLMQDPVAREQLAQFPDQESKEWFARMFLTMDNIGDKAGKTEVRYLNFSYFEAFFGRLLPNLTNEIIRQVVSEVPEKEKRFYWILRLQWKAMRLAYFSDMFVDYVRFSAFDNKNLDPTRKYHIRDYALTVMQVYSELAQFDNVRTRADVREAGDFIDSQMRILNAERFWVPKHHKPPFPLLPEFISNIFFRGRLTCEELYR